MYSRYGKRLARFIPPDRLDAGKRRLVKDGFKPIALMRNSIAAK